MNEIHLDRLREIECLARGNVTDRVRPEELQWLVDVAIRHEHTAVGPLLAESDGYRIVLKGTVLYLESRDTDALGLKRYNHVQSWSLTGRHATEERANIVMSTQKASRWR